MNYSSNFDRDWKQSHKQNNIRHLVWMLPDIIYIVGRHDDIKYSVKMLKEIHLGQNQRYTWRYRFDTCVFANKFFMDLNKIQQAYTIVSQYVHIINNLSIWKTSKMEQTRQKTIICPLVPTVLDSFHLNRIQIVSKQNSVKSSPRSTWLFTSLAKVDKNAQKRRQVILQLNQYI